MVADKSDRIFIRLPPALRADLARLAEELSAAAQGVEVSESEAARQALGAGIAALRARLAPQKGAKKPPRKA